MITRNIEELLRISLDEMPVVALLGSRQVGKTTLAWQISRQLDKEHGYLDLELASDLAKLDDAESYLNRFKGKLLIIDEVQLKPELFSVLRALVDIRRREGEKHCQFLLLGSASRDLLQHSSESLAGRIRYLELCPFNVLEIYKNNSVSSFEKLWYRGGYPDSYLASTNDGSWNWRNDFISTYVQRDIPLMGPQVSVTKMKRFWSMLAHFHGQQIVFTELAKSLEVSHSTVRNYLDILTDFYMIRQVQPWAGNTKKRLIKSPKIYVRDSGLLHNLLFISSFDALLGHPVLGASWEGFVIENIIQNLSSKWRYSYYRTSNQTEIDLVLENSEGEIWAIEIKRSVAPKVKKSFYDASEDIGATRRYVIYGGEEQYSISGEAEVIPLLDFLKLLR